MSVVLPARRALWLQRLDRLHLLVPLRIVAIIVVAVLAAMLVRRLIERLVSRVLGIGPLGSGDRGNPRSRSLSSALRSAVLVAIWTVAVVAVMDELGVNVGGVVFTATIIGGALAFGAQTLVRDLIAGVFVLAEDQYGVGDIIDVGTLTGGASAVSGTVERISLRATRLRDSDGRIWHIPNGAVARVANLSLKSVAALEIHVVRSTPLEVLRQVGDELCAALAAHPIAGPLCLEPPINGGVSDLRDDRIVSRLSVRTQPGRHDDVRGVWRELEVAMFQAGRLTPPAAVWTPPGGSS